MYSEEFCKNATAMATRTGDYILEFYRLDEDNLDHVRKMAIYLGLTHDTKLSSTPKFVLDMGCGTGEFLFHFLNACPNYFGFGVNLYGSQLLPCLPDSMRLIEGDLEDPTTWGAGLPQGFDVIFMNYVSGHVDIGKAFTVAKDRLKPGGTFAMWDLCPRTPMVKDIAGYKIRTPWEMRQTAALCGFETFNIVPWIPEDIVSPGVQKCLSEEDIDTFTRLTRPILYYMRNSDGSN